MSKYRFGVGPALRATTFLLILGLSARIFAQPDTVGLWLPPFNHADPAGVWNSYPSLINNPGTLFEAVHMTLIPTGQHRGSVLAVDWSFNAGLIGNPAFAVDFRQRYAIIKPGSYPMISPSFVNGIHDLNPDNLAGAQGDMMCGGHAWMPNGKLFWAGGNSYVYTPGPSPLLGHKKTWIYTPPPVGNPGAGWWNRTADMAMVRWYPTVNFVDPGTVIVTGGTTSSNGLSVNSYEIFTSLGALIAPPVPGPFPLTFGDYPRLFQLPTGPNNFNFFMAGESPYSVQYDPFVGGYIFGNWWHSPVTDFSHGSAVLLPNFLDAQGQGAENIVARIGGSQAPTVPNTLNVVEWTDATDSAPSSPGWSPGPPLNIPRWNLNTVLLPDGSILAIGGSTNVTNFQYCPGVSTPPSPVYEAELFSLSNGIWKLTGPMASSRFYHSTALLLPDATVLTGGGDPGGSFCADPAVGRTWDYQIYVPPYLLNGSERPVIKSAPSTMTRSNSSSANFYTVNHRQFSSAGSGAAKVVLMSPGAVTHHFDMGQRYVECVTVTRTPTSLTFAAPLALNDRSVSISSHAGAGYYMLFLVSNSGVPSVAEWVYLN